MFIRASVRELECWTPGWNDDRATLQHAGIIDVSNRPTFGTLRGKSPISFQISIDPVLAHYGEGRDLFVESWNELLQCVDAKRNAMKAA